MTGLGMGLGVDLGGAKSPFDPMAQSFFDRAAITNSTQKSATNQLVKDLRSGGIIGKFPAIYPYLGGTAGSHAVNLISSLYTITWTGSVTHNANGVTGDGSTGYGDTGIKPSDIGSNGGISLYMRGLPAGDNNITGCTNGSGTSHIVNFNVTSAQSYGRWGADASIATQVAAVQTGFFSINRTSATSLSLYRNGSSIATDATNSAASPLSLNLFVLAANSSGSAAFFTEENDALAAFHQGLTAGENTIWYNAVQAYQTTLGRNV